MVQKEIIFGHIVSERRIEVDKAKIEVISKLPPSTLIQRIRSFLGHAWFYRCFIKNFSKILRPLCNLLIKDTPFVFNEECLQAFHTLRAVLTTAPIIKPPDWFFPFEIMCEAFDFAIRTVLGQRINKEPYVIYYANKTLSDV